MYFDYDLPSNLFEYTLTPIDHKKLGYKFTKKEEAFIEALYSDVNTTLIVHLNVVESYLKKDRNYHSEENYPIKLALEYSTLYYHILIGLHCRMMLSEPLFDVIEKTFLNSFQILEKEVKAKGFGSLVKFYHKRAIDLAKLFYEKKLDYLSHENEMNFRKIFITEPLAYIDFLQPLQVDVNIERALESIDFFTRTIILIGQVADILIKNHLKDLARPDNIQLMQN